MATKMMKVGEKSAYRASVAVTRVISYIFLIFLLILCIFPFYTLIINATRLNAEIQSGFTIIPGRALIFNFKNLFSDANLMILRALWNSIFVSGCAAVLTTYFSAMTAYGIHAYDFRFKKFAFTFIMIIMMVPVQVSTLGFLRLISDMGLMDTFWPLIVPAIAAPAVFFFMIQYMRSVLPHAIIEAARIDGSNEFRTFNTIVLPIIKPAMAVQAIFSFVASWNNFFVPALVINSKEKKTIPIVIAQLRSADYMKFDLGQVYAMIAVAIVPVLIFYLLMSRYIIQGVTLGSVKG